MEGGGELRSSFWGVELLPPRAGDRDRLLYCFETPRLECACCGAVFTNMVVFNEHYKREHCVIVPVQVADPVTGKPIIARRVYRSVRNCRGASTRQSAVVG